MVLTSALRVFLLLQGLLDDDEGRLGGLSVLELTHVAVGAGGADHGWTESDGRDLLAITREGTLRGGRARAGGGAGRGRGARWTGRRHVALASR